MAKIKVAPLSFERWCNSVDYFLSNFNWKIEESELDIETLFKQGVNPIDAHRMIMGLKNSPNEDIDAQEFVDIDTYILGDFIPGEA